MSDTLRQFVFLNSGGRRLSVSSIQTGVKSEEDLTPNSPSASVGSTEVVPGSPTSFVTVSAASAAPELFVASIPSASTVLVVGANEVVTQTTPPSLSLSETALLDLKLPRSPESAPRDAPSPDSSGVSGLDYAQEKVWCLRSVHVRVFTKRFRFVSSQTSGDV